MGEKRNRKSKVVISSSLHSKSHVIIGVDDVFLLIRENTKWREKVN
jgi:hypothetical protein